MKKMNKKGFTIVELSIVIAVIAILSAVLIPTFSGIVRKAKKSAREQLASNAYHIALGLSEYATYDNGDPNVIDAYIAIKEKDTTYYYAVEAGKVQDEKTDAPDLADYEEVSLEEDLGDVTFYKAK